jgi:CheY-like chemotaxis protein
VYTKPKVAKSESICSKITCFDVNRLFNLGKSKEGRVCNTSINIIKIKKILSFIYKYTLTNHYNRNKSTENLIIESWNNYNLIESKVIRKNNKDIDEDNEDNSYENIRSSPESDSPDFQQNGIVNSNFNNSDRKKFLDAPILLVDDEEDILTVFRIFLQSEGYNNIAAFSSSKEALDHISSLKDLSYYKLALLDIKMPEINGERLYQILKIIHPSLKVIFLTSFSNVDDLTQQHPEIQQKDILRKPIERKEFVKIINYHVSKICNS